MATQQEKLKELGEETRARKAEIEKTLYYDDFVNSFRRVMDFVKEAKEELASGNTEAVTKLEGQIENALAELRQEAAQMGMTMTSFQNETRSDARTTLRMIEQQLADIRAEMTIHDTELEEHTHPDLIARIDALQTALNGIEIPDEFDPSEILESHEAMKNDIEELKKRPATSGGGVRRVFQPYLDRFQGDGSTKTFYLSREPLRTNNIEVWGTDFPIVLDPENDFTVTGKDLTLTSEVDAPTNGAIIVIKYYA